MLVYRASKMTNIRLRKGYIGFSSSTMLTLDAINLKRIPGITQKLDKSTSKATFHQNYRTCCKKESIHNSSRKCLNTQAFTETLQKNYNSKASILILLKIKKKDRSKVFSRHCGHKMRKPKNKLQRMKLRPIHH